MIGAVLEQYIGAKSLDDYKVVIGKTKRLLIRALKSGWMKSCWITAESW